MSSTKRSPERWGEAYEVERSRHVAFTGALESLLRQLLDQASIPYTQIESRTKEVPNFVAKLRRKNEKYDDPLTEVTDLVGLRIVLFYLDDVERVSELIEEQFSVDQEHSDDKSAALDPDRFGYLSVHHIVRMPPTRSELPEWKSFGGLCAEVQVRTVLQHAWAAISRKLAYASVREAPRHLQRNLNRLSALLELADDEFVDIRNAREQIEAAYDRELERGNLDLEIDESSLEAYLREADVRNRIGALAREAGSPVISSKAEAFDESFYEEVISRSDKNLLQAIEAAGLRRISELDDLLNQHWTSIPEFMLEVNRGYVDTDEQPMADRADNWLTLVVLWAVRAPAEPFEELGYVDELVDVIRATYSQD